MKTITFARYMENAEIDLQLFQNRKQKRAVTITSGGCMALTLALAEPEVIYAIDSNPHQNHLLELKIASIRALEHADYKALMLGTAPRARDLYTSCRPHLSPEARAFWDRNSKRMQKGLLFCGITETVASWFGKSIELMMGKQKIRRLFELTDPDELSAFYDSHWNTVFWQSILKLFTSETLLSRFVDFRHLGFKEFQQHVKYLFKRTVTVMPPRANYFLSPLLLNRYYDDDHVPLFLRKAHFDRLRQHVDRIVPVHTGFDEFINNGHDRDISYFSLSNITDWQDISTFVSIYSRIERICSPDAMITFRNVLNLQALDEALTATAFDKQTDLLAAVEDQEWFFYLSIWGKG